MALRLPATVAVLCAAASASVPILPDTDVPWLNERPSEGIAIWDGSSSGAALDALGEFRLCIIRVEFVEDFTPLTTGDGRFDMKAQPPHDREYTEGLAADMASWLYDVSGGGFELSFDVYPASGAYHMDHQMSYYGADSTWAAGICLLLRDAVRAADVDVDFSEYDAVMVVHAGAGQEADILRDSPDDIHSAFMTLGNLAYYLPEGGVGFLGIPTDDGVYVREGLIVPEQESQDGFGLGVIGTMIHEFMHQLGLPDLYDTLSGGVGVGGWDIMGYGQWMSAGFWPTAPGAWSRVRLGWADVVDASGGGTWSVECGGDVLRVDLSGSEYLLIENRQRDPNGDGLCGEHERDYGLPGSGILIWHVDDGVLAANMAANTVNVDPDHKGVDLEEADGIQDFDYSLSDTYGIMGSEYDPFFIGGYSHTFGPSTIPSSATSWGGFTGVTVEIGSAPGNSMQVTVDPISMTAGWPVQTRPVARGPFLWNSQDGPAVLLLSTTGQLLKLDPASPGEPVTAIATGVTGPPAAAPLGGGEYDCLVWMGDDRELHLLDPRGHEKAGWPVPMQGVPVRCAALPATGAVLAATDRNQVFLYDLDGEVMPGWPRTVTERTTGLAFCEDDPSAPVLFASTAGGRLYAWRLDGNPVHGWPVESPGGSPVSPPLAADLDRDGEVEVTVLCGRTISCFSPSGSPKPGFPVQTRDEPMGVPWLCDPDSDGHIDIAVETSAGVEAYEASGALLLDWPEILGCDPAGIRSDANAGCGGRGFAAHFTRDGRIFIRNAFGAPLPGFPLSTGDGPLGAPLFIDLDGNGSYGLLACDESGWTGFWNDIAALDGWFPGLDFSGSGCWPSSLLPALAAPGGGISEGSFFVYPNPVSEGRGVIRFDSGASCAYSIRVFNIAGELVSAFDGNCEAGLACEVDWDTSNLSPGLYFVCLSAGGHEALFHAAVTGR